MPRRRRDEQRTMSVPPQEAETLETELKKAELERDLARQRLSTSGEELVRCAGPRCAVPGREIPPQPFSHAAAWPTLCD